MKKIPQLTLQIHPRKLACLLKIVVGRRPVSFEMDPFFGDMLAFRVYFSVGVYLCTRRWIMFDWFPFRAKRKIQKALVDEVYGSMPARFAFWHVSSHKAIHLSFFIFSSLYVSTSLSISSYHKRFTFLSHVWIHAISTGCFWLGSFPFCHVLVPLLSCSHSVKHSMGYHRGMVTGCILLWLLRWVLKLMSFACSSLILYFQRVASLELRASSRCFLHSWDPCFATEVWPVLLAQADLLHLH